MAQHQFLIIALGITIVGTATLVGVTGVGRAQDNFLSDETHMQATNIAHTILEWKKKPDIFGGGAETTYLNGMTMTKLGLKASDSTGVRSDTDLFFRSVHNLNSSQPFVEVSPKGNPDMRIQLTLFGTSDKCFVYQKSYRLGNKWIDEISGELSAPADCTGWRW